MRQLKIAVSITNRDSVSLDKYLSDISNEPMISAEEEVALAQRIKKGDQVALEKLVKANLRFVISVAKQYQGNILSLPDLISEGNLGLIKAAMRFDETRGFKFISYAVWWIRQSIIQSIAVQARIVRLPLNQIGNLNKMKRAFAEFEQKNDREPSAEELAEVMDFPVEKIEVSLQNRSFHISLDAPLIDSETFCLADKLVGGDAKDTDNQLIYESLQTDIKLAMKCLSKLEKEVILLYYGIGLEKPETLASIAFDYDLSTERIRQVKKTALRKLKLKLERKTSSDF